MADPRDVAATKLARREFSRKGVDVTGADVRVMHGVVYVKGMVKAIKGEETHDVKDQVLLVAKILRTRQGIHDVVIDVSYKY